MQNSKIAYLFVNLGSPEKPYLPSIRRYLKEFLMDKRVMDVPFFLRFFIVYGFILPFRPNYTLKKYKAIWDFHKNRSPLISITEEMIHKLKQRLPDFTIEFAMRYGNPSLRDKFDSFYKEGIRHIHIIPLFPQYATSTYGSIIAEVSRINKNFWDPFLISFEPLLYNQKEFIELWIRKIKAIQNYHQYFVLFSFHGIPIRHIQKSDPFRECLKENCCLIPKEYCYRSQTFYISRAVADGLGILNWSIAYQSRLGKAEWLRPYLEDKIYEIIKKYKKILIVPLSFVSDCLETLEELKLTLKESIQRKFSDIEIQVLDSLNMDDDWIHFWEKKILKRNSLYTDY